MQLPVAAETDKKKYSKQSPNIVRDFVEGPIPSMGMTGTKTRSFKDRDALLGFRWLGHKAPKERLSPKSARGNRMIHQKKFKGRPRTECDGHLKR